MKTLIAILTIGIVSVASASHSDSNARTKRIWEWAENRMFNQQDLWFDEGDFPAAIQLLKVEAEKEPADYEIWTNLGWMQENVEQWDSALATYIRFKKDNPKDPDASLPEGQYYFMKKMYEKTISVLEPAVKSKTCHPNNYRLLASSYDKQKMYADAIRVWNLYLSRFPNDLAAKSNLARIQKKLK